MAIELKDIVTATLERMRAIRFDDAQVGWASPNGKLSTIINEANMLRSTEDYGVTLMGLVDGRKASAALTNLSEDTIAHEVTERFARHTVGRPPGRAP